MLSSRDSRFSWGKHDRSAARPYSCVVSRKWRPTMRKRVVDNAPLGAAKKPAAGLKARPVWTPWLWIE